MSAIFRLRLFLTVTTGLAAIKSVLQVGAPGQTFVLTAAELAARPRPEITGGAAVVPMTAKPQLEHPDPGEKPRPGR